MCNFRFRNAPEDGSSPWTSLGDLAVLRRTSSCINRGLATDVHCDMMRSNVELSQFVFRCSINVLERWLQCHLTAIGCQ